MPNTNPIPLVSIIVPTFNQGRFIADCLNSIARQSYTNLEVLIFDALSTDETPMICRDFAEKDSRFKYFCEPDRGQSDALNKGLALSKGFFWTWICSDDRYSSIDAIDTLVKTLVCKLDDGRVAGSFGLAQYITEQGLVERPYQVVSENVCKDTFFNQWPFAQPASLLIREQVIACGGIDINLHLGMDLDLFIRTLSGDSKVMLFTNHLIADVRHQADSKSVKLRKATAINSLEIIKKHFGKIGDLSSSDYVKELRAVCEENEFYLKLIYLGAHKMSTLVWFIRLKLRPTLAGKLWGKVKRIFVN